MTIPKRKFVVATVGTTALLLTIVPRPAFAAGAGSMAFASFASISGSPILVDYAYTAPLNFDEDGFDDSILVGSNEISFGGPNPGTEAVPAPTDAPFIAFAGDFNGDGISDLLLNAGANQPITAMLLGYGAGPGTPRALFSSPVAVSLDVPSGMQTLIVDANADGSADLIVWAPGGTAVDIYFGGHFQRLPFVGSPMHLTLGGPFVGVHSGLLNGDFFGDMVVVSDVGPGGTASVFQGGPSGLNPVASMPLTNFVVGLGDINGDNLADIGTGAALDRWAVQLPAQPASISFGPVTSIPGNPTLLGDAGVPAPDDFDGDGFTDTLNTATGQITFGGPNPAVETVAVPAADPSIVGSGDFNGDGRSDLMLGYAQPATGVDAVLPGAGGGPGGPRALFGAPIATGFGGNNFQFIVYDIDLDGADDMVYWDATQNGAYVSFGSATVAPFTVNFVSILPNFAGSLAGLRSADLDGDGYADLLISTGSGPGGATLQLQLYQGGPGGFVPVTSWSGGATTSGALKIGDVNGDGLVDIGVGVDQWFLQAVVGPPPLIPEVPVPVLLPLSAVAIAAVALRTERRRWASQ